MASAKPISAKPVDARGVKPAEVAGRIGVDGRDLEPGSPEADAQELQLVRVIQAGGPGAQEAWADLLGRYQDRLFGVCYRMVHDREQAADLTQDAMVKVIEGLATYNGQAKLSTWMIRVTMNVCLSKLRSEKLRKHASLDGFAAGGAGERDGPGAAETLGVQRPGSGGDSAGPTELGPSESVERSASREVLLRALALLPEDQRSLVVLRDCRDLDYDQIAEILGVPVGTVKSRLFRARVALRELVEGLESGRDVED